MSFGERVFAPVGQGAFYYEKLDNRVYVYDCGSSSDPKQLETEINKAFARGERIDAVFISHMHDDHINGLSHLLNRCKVAKLYLPLLDKAQRLLAMCALSAQKTIQLDSASGNDWLRTLIQLINEELPKVELGESSAIVKYVAPRIEPGNETEGDRVVESGFPERDRVVESGIPCESINDWVLIPVNIKYKKRNEKLLAALNSRGIPASSVEEAHAYIQNAFSEDDREVLRKVKSAYVDVIKNPNSHSMALYSGPLYSSYRKKQQEKTSCQAPGCMACGCGVCYAFGCCSRCCCRLNRRFNAGALYLGDFMAHQKTYWGELLKALPPNALTLIGCLQVPHHGSKNNFRDDFVKDDWLSVISAGSNGDHPSGAVVQKYLNANITPRVVSELPNTMVALDIFVG